MANLADSIKLYNLPEGVEVAYTYYSVRGNANDLVDIDDFNNIIGDVVVKATLTPVDAVNYALSVSEIKNDIQIKKAVIDLSDLIWAYNQSQYNGGALDLSTLLNLPEGVEVDEFIVNSIANGEIKNAGEYKVTVTLKPTDNAHYVLSGNNLGELTFTVTKAAGQISGFAPSYTYIYNGNILDGFKTGVAGNHAETELVWALDEIKNAGEYTVTVTLPESANYTAATATATVIVSKAVIDPADFTLVGAEFEYDKNYHALTVEGANIDLFDIIYTYNGVTSNGTSLCGEYTVIATLTLKDSNNYMLVDMDATAFSLCATLKIAGDKVIDLSNLKWSVDDGQVIEWYDGLTESITPAIPTGVKIVSYTYICDGATYDHIGFAGDWTIIATVALDAEAGFTEEAYELSHNEVSVEITVYEAEENTEKDHSICEGGWFERLMNAIGNFFRKLFGMPEKCICGDIVESKE